MSTPTSSHADDLRELNQRLLAAITPILTDPLNPYAAETMAASLRELARACDLIAAEPFIPPAGYSERLQ